MNSLIRTTFSAPSSPGEEVRAHAQEPDEVHDQAAPSKPRSTQSRHVLSRHSIIGQMDDNLESREADRSDSGLEPRQDQSLAAPTERSTTLFEDHDLAGWRADDMLSNMLSDMLTDMLGLHVLPDFGFAPLDEDFAMH